MTPKFPAATKLAVLFAAAAAVTAGFVAPPASAQTKRQQQYDNNGRPYYGANGPNRSYQQGPNTRVYITTRSWLDAGTEEGDPSVISDLRTLRQELLEKGWREGVDLCCPWQLALPLA